VPRWENPQANLVNKLLDFFLESLHNIDQSLNLVANMRINDAVWADGLLVCMTIGVASSSCPFSQISHLISFGFTILAEDPGAIVVAVATTEDAKRLTVQRKSAKWQQ